MDGNWFLNTISCPLRNTLTMIIWIISSSSYIDVWNSSHLHRNYGAKELQSPWLTVVQSSWQFGALNLRSARAGALHAAPAFSAVPVQPQELNQTGWKRKGAPCCEGRNNLPRCSHVTLILSSTLDFISFQKPCHFTGPALNFSQINSDHSLYHYLIYNLNI